MVYKSHGEFSRRRLYTETLLAPPTERLGLVTVLRCKDPISSIVLNRSKVCFVIVCGSSGFCTILDKDLVTLVLTNGPLAQV